VVSDDTIGRLFVRLAEDPAAEWVGAAGQPIWRALPERVILDWDSAVQSKHDHQQGAERGYNPEERGRRSFHPLIALAAGARLAVAYRFRHCDTVTATQWEAATFDAQCWLGERTVGLNRGDLGLAYEKVMA